MQSNQYRGHVESSKSRHVTRKMDLSRNRTGRKSLAYLVAVFEELSAVASVEQEGLVVGYVGTDWGTQGQLGTED